MPGHEHYLKVPWSPSDTTKPMASSNKVASHDPIKSSEPPSHSTEFQLRKYLLLLATLVATVTYAAGLNLPGGAWQEDTKEGDVLHHAGDLILEYAAHSRYLAFYYCNATAFAASLVVCLLLLVLNGTNTGWEALLRLVMVLDLLGLMGAYAAGSCRDTFTTIYSTLLVCAVFAYIIIAFSTYVISNSQVLAVLLPKKQDVDTEKQDGKHGEDTVTQDKDTDTEEHEDELREVLMLLATFAVTITYVAGLSPPGGFWGDSKGGHKMSYPVLQEHYANRYQAFYVCNTTAFIASLLIIILLVDKKLSSNKSLRFVALYGLIITALFGLMGAYAAGSCREGDDTTYVVCLIGGVLAYIFLQVALTKAIKKKDSWCCFHLLATIHDSVSNWLKAIRDFFASQHQIEPDQTTSRNTTPTEAMEKARSLVMLLATLVVSITYQAGLDPPGGLWPSDGRTADGRDYKNGDPILLTTHPTRYKVFFYSNSAAFVASLIVIIMVQSRFLLRRHTLEAAMILDLFGLISAYAAGSCRDEITSIYVVALAGIVLVYVVIHIIFFTLDHQDSLPDAEKLENRREVLLLLAILAATLTYQAGLTPPGGFWSEDKGGHHAGYPVLHDNYNHRYSAYFYCNAASFMASVALIVLLVNPNLYRPGIRCYALYVCMMVGMFGLMGAYAAGSARDLRTSIYVLTLVAAVFAFVALEVIIFWVYPYLKKHPPRCFKMANGSSSSITRKKMGPQSETIGKTPEAQKEKNMREYLMLLGVLAASVTYQSGLKPPGGLWQDSNDHSGNPILHDINKARYYAFFYSNSTSFMASIVVVILLLPWTLHKHQLPLWPMQTAILLDMLGLLSAYAAGSTRDWETSRNVIYLVIPVLVYIAVYAAYAAVSIFLMKRQYKKQKSEEHKSSGND